MHNVTVGNGAEEFVFTTMFVGGAVAHPTGYDKIAM